MDLKQIREKYIKEEVIKSVLDYFETLQVVEV